MCADKYPQVQNYTKKPLSPKKIKNGLPRAIVELRIKLGTPNFWHFIGLFKDDVNIFLVCVALFLF